MTNKHVARLAGVAKPGESARLMEERLLTIRSLSLLVLKHGVKGSENQKGDVRYTYDLNQSECTRELGPSDELLMEYNFEKDCLQLTVVKRGTRFSEL